MAISEQIAERGSYQTHRIQFIREISRRTGTTVGKDEDFVNVVLETVKNKNLNDNRQFVMKRAGSGKLLDSVAAAEVRGMFYWDDQDKLFYAVNNNVYVYSFVTATTTTLAGVLSTTSGEVGFCEYLYDTNSVVVVVTDGTTLLQVDSSNTVTTCTDPDLPSPHLPFPVFIDGYLFLVKANSADVYNSDLNNPMAWTPGNFISAEMRGDLVIRIAVLNNYLIVFGTESIEYFWDAGNSSGSPMQRNDTPIKINKYIGAYAQYGNDIMFVGENEFGQPEVYKLKDFKIEEIGSYTVSRYLNLVNESSANWKAGIISSQGHSYYVLSVGSYTYVCQLDKNVWVRWAFQQSIGFSICSSARATTNTTRRSCFAFKGSDSTIFYMSDSLYQDNGINFTCTVITEAMDFGNMNRKIMARLSFVGDRPSGNSNVIISWSDDDYQTFSNTRSVDLNQDLPSTYRLGSFRQRCLKIEYTDNFPFRLQMFEVDINKGIS